MIDKVITAWGLARICWRVLMLDKELLIFPILSFTALALTVAGIVWPIYDSGYLDTLVTEIQGAPDTASMAVLMAIGYGCMVVTTFIYVFFNAALIGCARIRFAGGDPTVGDGLRIAVGRLPLILAWSLVAATVGFLLSRVRDGKGLVGRIIGGLVGTAWAIMTYFAIPVLVMDRVGPVQAMKTSAGLIRRTWGETAVSEIGLSAVGFVAAIPACFLIFAGSALFETQPAVGAGLIGVALVMMALTALVVTTLSAILRTALYVYAVEGRMPAAFDRIDPRRAFGRDRR